MLLNGMQLYELKCLLTPRVLSYRQAKLASFLQHLFSVDTLEVRSAPFRLSKKSTEDVSHMLSRAFQSKFSSLCLNTQNNDLKLSIF